MKSKRLVGEEGRQTYVLVFDQGDEAKAELERFVREHGLTGAHFTGIGAFSDVTLGHFDWERKEHDETLTETPAELCKSVDAETGLALIDLDR